MKINGYCPMGCGTTLDVDEDGNVFCTLDACPRPTAAYEVLRDRESEHVVQFDDEVFTVRHPLRERLDDALMECELHATIAAMSGPPVRPGRYRALDNSDDSWTFQVLQEADPA